jgi:hypothetical protein
VAAARREKAAATGAPGGTADLTAPAISKAYRNSIPNRKFAPWLCCLALAARGQPVRLGRRPERPHLGIHVHDSVLLHR